MAAPHIPEAHAELGDSGTAPIFAVAWIGHQQPTTAPADRAVRGLAEAIGLSLEDAASGRLAVMMKASGDGVSVDRFIAGLSLRGAAILRSESFTAPPASTRSVLVFIGAAPQPPFQQI